MLIYVIIFLFLLVPVVAFHGKEEKNRYNGYFWLELIVLILFMGLRYKIGGDSIRYEEMFDTKTQKISQLLATREWWLMGYQPGWILLMSLCKTITNSFVAVQLLEATAINTAVFLMVRRNCRHPFTFVLLYYICNYIYFSTEILREGFSVAFFLLGYRYLVRKQYLKYYGFAFLGFMFHASAFILFFLPLVYPLLSRLKGARSTVYVIAAALLAGLMVIPLAAIIGNMYIFSNDYWQQELEMVTGDLGLNIFGIVAKLFWLYPAIMASVYLNPRIEKDEFKSKNFILKGYLFVAAVGVIFPSLQRLENYFSIMFLMVFVDFITDRRYYHRYKLQIYAAVLILFIYQAIWYTGPMYTNAHLKKYRRWIPYSSVLDPEKDLERERAIKVEFFKLKR